MAGQTHSIRQIIITVGLGNAPQKVGYSMILKKKLTELPVGNCFTLEQIGDDGVVYVYEVCHQDFTYGWTGVKPVQYIYRNGNCYNMPKIGRAHV